MNEPNFSAIDTLEKTLALTEKGDLTKMLLLPELFGGDDAPPNTVYVPFGIAAIKTEADQNVIAPLVAAGKVTKYSATPRYSGKSFVPIAIEITATDPGHFTFELKVWGDA